METKTTALVWFTNDLRISDHEGLARACSQFDNVVGAFILEPNHDEEDNWGFPIVGKNRMAFLLETLENLSYDLETIGVPLQLFKASAKVAIEDLVAEHGISRIYTEKKFYGDALRQEKEVLSALPPDVEVEFYNGRLLYHPSDVPFEQGSFPDDFYSFRKIVELKCQPRDIIDLPAELLDLVDEAPSFSFSDSRPSDPRPDNDERSSFPFRGGERYAQYRLNEYVWNTKTVTSYTDTCDEISGVETSTKLSPWLANGSLSPRQLFYDIKRFERKIIKSSSTYRIVLELIRRDYYLYRAMVKPDSLFASSGYADVEYSCESNPDTIRKWTEGKTENEFVNANMIELATTGWMSRTGRRIVASYFCNELKQDWRVGAAWFASQLIDHDEALNYGCWMDVAGVGEDPESHMWLNVSAQAKRHDPDREYQQLWLSDAGVRAKA